MLEAYNYENWRVGKGWSITEVGSCRVCNPAAAVYVTEVAPISQQLL